MNAPTSAALASAVVFGQDNMLFTAGAVGLVVGGVLVWAETRYKVAVQDKLVTVLEGKVGDLESKVTALESARDVTNQRVDHILELLSEVRADVKQLLQRGQRDVA